MTVIELESIDALKSKERIALVKKEATYSADRFSCLSGLGIRARQGEQSLRLHRSGPVVGSPIIKWRSSC